MTGMRSHGRPSARAALRPVLAALALLGACAPASDGGIASGSGTAERPRIVSLNPCADAILAEVAPGHLLAISHYSHDPQGASMDADMARRFASTDGTAEEIAALDPDIVVAGTFLPPATEQALNAMRLRVVKVGGIASIDDARRQVRGLAALADEPEAGEKLVAQIDAALEETAASRGERPAPALLWQSGGLVPGDDTLIGDLLRHTGFSSHSAARGLGQGAIVPLEEVMADPPAVLISTGQDRMALHPALEHLASGTIRADMPARLVWCGGPTIGQAAHFLAGLRKDVSP